MKLATLTSLVLKASIVLLVFGLGLDVTVHDLTYLWRRAELFLRSLLAMNVVMPLVTVALVALFDLHPAVKVVLVALSLSPAPPFFPKQGLKAGGGVPFTFSLLVAEAALAILFVPIGVWVCASAFDVPAQVPPAAVAQIVLLTVMVPLAAGMLIRHRAPAVAARIAPPVSRLAIVMLGVSFLPIPIVVSPATVSLLGGGTLAAITAFAVLGLAAGHLLGGPKPEQQVVLALSTSSRHPAVALAIAGACFPEQRLVLAALLLYLMVNAIMSLSYLSWRRLHGPKAEAAQATALRGTVGPASPTL
ncbi:MAG TPA: Na+-dependent transporter [Blastocatellia bacterium]|nr:Na+-dependent transporter [Blastocatellia bacterium]